MAQILGDLARYLGIPGAQAHYKHALAIAEQRTWSRGARPPAGAWIRGRQHLPGHWGGTAGSATHIRAATGQISQFGRSKSANRDGQEAVQIGGSASALHDHLSDSA